MDQLETESQNLQDKIKQIDGKEYVTTFAFKAFLHADDEDKEGRTSKYLFLKKDIE